LQAAVACVEPSVLRVIVRLSAKDFSEGSSFVVRADATGTYLLANRHVVEGGTVVVTPDDKMAYHPLVILPNGGKSGTAGDLAVIKLRPGLGLRPLACGDSEHLGQGETVASIGYGLGLVSPPSVTEGIVSAVHRDLGDGYGPVWIQHQSTINHGNSDGPLITTAGDVVGVNTLAVTQLPSGESGVQGLFFAIPSDAARRVAATLEARLGGPAVAQPRPAAPAATRYQGRDFAVILPPGWFVGHLHHRCWGAARSDQGGPRAGPDARQLVRRRRTVILTHPWPPHDAEESILSADPRQTAIANMRWGLNRVGDAEVKRPRLLLNERG